MGVRYKRSVPLQDLPRHLVILEWKPVKRQEAGENDERQNRGKKSGNQPTGTKGESFGNDREGVAGRKLGRHDAEVILARYFLVCSVQYSLTHQCIVLDITLEGKALLRARLIP